MNDDKTADLVTGLVHKIGLILAGHHGHVQGAVLADLTGTWLAGYQIKNGSPEETHEARADMLAHQIKFIWQHVAAEDERWSATTQIADADTGTARNPVME
jgi:hypothetical protein